MRKVLWIPLAVIGLVQFAAMYAGFVDALGPLGVVLALVIAEVPLVGTAFGVYGAVGHWEIPLYVRYCCSRVCQEHSS